MAVERVEDGLFGEGRGRAARAASGRLQRSAELQHADPRTTAPVGTVEGRKMAQALREEVAANVPWTPVEQLAEAQ